MAHAQMLAPRAHAVHGTITGLGVLVCSTPTPLIDMSEVLRAVESLYRDQLRPYGRILRKRLAERTQGDMLEVADVDIKQLRIACESCPWFSMQSEEGGDWSVVLRNQAETFVDVYSHRDPYPAELWLAITAYFEGLSDTEMILPGGRYSCAQALVSRHLPFLAGRSLGQVCHIVQLAISQRKLLGYLNGAVVPYGRSQSMVKERCAMRQRPCTGSTRATSTIASWDTVRACLRELLRVAGPDDGHVALSNVKRLFRSKFRIELSETALGHAKLSELLQDPRMQDVCSVELRGQGYVVVPRVPAVPRNLISLADTLHQHAATDLPSHTQAPNKSRWVPEPLSLDDMVSPSVVPVSNSSTSCSAGTAEPTPFTDPGFDVQTPSPASMQCARSLPRLLGKPDPGAGMHDQVFGHALPSTKPAPGAMPFSSAADKRARSTLPAEQVIPSVRPISKATSVLVDVDVPTWPVLTPGVLGNLGFAVHNTFIHAVVRPTTPSANGACRSLSLPRNMGSGTPISRSQALAPCKQLEPAANDGSLGVTPQPTVRHSAAASAFAGVAPS